MSWPCFWPFYSSKCVEGLFCEVRLDGVLTARCRESEPMRTWQHDERLLRRPKTQDSFLGRSRDAQGRSGTHLLREPLFGQTLRKEGRRMGIAGSEEKAGGRPEARREGHEALGGGPAGAPLRPPKRALRVHRACDGNLGEPLHDVPRHSPCRP